MIEGRLSLPIHHVLGVGRRLHTRRRTRPTWRRHIGSGWVGHCKNALAGSLVLFVLLDLLGFLDLLNLITLVRLSLVASVGLLTISQASNRPDHDLVTLISLSSFLVNLANLVNLVSLPVWNHLGRRLRQMRGRVAIHRGRVDMPSGGCARKQDCEGKQGCNQSCLPPSWMCVSNLPR